MSSTCDDLDIRNVDDVDVDVDVAVGSLPVVAARGARVGVVVALAAFAPAITDDEDVPKRQPVLAWEHKVACDTAAELAAATDSSPVAATLPWPGMPCTSTNTPRQVLQRRRFV